MNSRSQSSKTVSDDLSDFIGRVTIRNISPDVRETAKLHLLDGLATMLGGVNEKSSRLLRRRFSVRKLTGEATVLGSHNKFSAEHAALINGVQGHVLDYDDAQLATLPSRPMGQQTHPTTPVLAAALALAESRRATGAALLNSYIVGLEVACRLGDAVDPSHYLDGFHPTGTLGAFGATAACAQLLRLSPLSIRHALGIAGTLASGLRANRGTMAKGLNAGRAAENGVIATTLAADGFTASENIFDDPMGFFSAACRGRVNTDLLRFGERFFIAKPGIAIKLYPCAGVLHPVLDLTLDLRVRHRIEPNNIDRIRVGLDTNAALPLVYENPKDNLQAKFSLNFAVAVAIVDGKAGLKQFTAERVHDPKIKRLMKRVELVRRPLRQEKHETGVDSEIEIVMIDGAVHRARGSVARGHPSLPASRAEIEDKLRQCAEAPSVAAWLRPLRPPRR
ncbi:MAG: MmgE/PrpD family protein [Deltaproteobacteria bacterium]|nr:MAG: MmgE/PrpD family protein [Deltaproteobacteria bacterium]